MKEDPSTSVAPGPGVLLASSTAAQGRPGTWATRECLGDGAWTAPNDTAITGRLCSWCRSAPAKRRFCSRKCRQAAFRARQRTVVEVLNDQPMTMAYADPPYPGLAAKYYADQPDFAGEVDHTRLISSLAAGGYDGWALSTSTKALRDVLPLCPPRARVCAWVKPIGASPRSFGIHNTWEPLIVVPGRSERPGKRDWLSAQPARHGGTLPGRKPVAFAAWLFGLLGMRRGDQLVELFPGTGIITRAWAEACRGRGGA